MVGKIYCKNCGVTFANSTEYLNFEGCDKDTCTMGRNKQARQAANAAIEAARKSSGTATYLCHKNEHQVEFGKDIPKDVATVEKTVSNVITFHVMKR